VPFNPHIKNSSPSHGLAPALSLVLLAFAVVAYCGYPAAAQSPGQSFAVKGDHFELDGKPFQVIAGEVHYERVPRAYWRNRLEMAKAMGLNTIATYVFWNVHEPKPGVYDFTDNYDLAAFLKLAQEEHLYVLLRAGPYSCAEWEFGGFPAWLLNDPQMSTALRANDPAFLIPVERWMKRLGEEVGSFQIENGGPIIATQIENEYGNFSNDHAYMERMRDIFIAAGFNKSLLYTVDPSKALANGEIDGIYSGVNFGTGNAERGLNLLSARRPGQPLFSTEYWPGWFDLWGHPHETRPLAPQLVDLDYILGHGASINIYMFHGGTSFGMMAGASQSTGSYRGNVTSYDYDAPLDEAGHPPQKFFAYRDVILKYTHQVALPVPPTPPVIAISPFTLERSVSLWDHLPRPISSDQPLTMEQIDQAYGYVLYRRQLPGGLHRAKLHLDHLQDFAMVYINGKLAGTLDRHFHQDTIAVDTTQPSQLDILVENTGRLNSTKWMRDERKGIRAVELADRSLLGWEIYSLPMSEAPALKPGNIAKMQAPHFASGTFELQQTGDTYLDVRALGKGLLWINGHALGRFWNVGPQGTLYLPAPWLKKGRNEVTIFELLGASSAPELAGLTKPLLDEPTPGYESDPEHQKKPAADAEFGPQLATPATSSPTAPKE
jgi:beta-galactosidase